jgi:hypothetical protein
MYGLADYKNLDIYYRVCFMNKHIDKAKSGLIWVKKGMFLMRKLRSIKETLLELA